MLETLTLDTFSPHVGGTFRIRLDDARTVDLALVEAKSLAPEPARAHGLAKRQPFALTFKGPTEFILPQQIYHLEHDVLPAIELFIVPVAPGEYEAIFS